MLPIYSIHRSPHSRFLLRYIFFFVSKVHGIIELFVILVYPLMKRYDGQRGKAKWLKWFFYIYYPAHLVVIGIIRIIMYGDTPILF